MKRGEDRELLALTGNDPDALNFEILRNAAELGNSLALHLLSEVGTHLGLALANTMNILDPTAVLIGGEILPVIDLVLPKMREIVTARSFRILKNKVVIEKVGLGQDAVAVGAATLIFEDLFQP
jgi:predicted NBD/HSP70 family sugar kinase